MRVGLVGAVNRLPADSAATLARFLARRLGVLRQGAGATGDQTLRQGLDDVGGQAVLAAEREHLSRRVRLARQNQGFDIALPVLRRLRGGLECGQKVRQSDGSLLPQNLELCLLYTSSPGSSGPSANARR